MFRYIKSFLILISITVILSCNNKVIDEITNEVEQGGGIELSIPTISSELKADLLKTAFQIDSRAVLGTQRIDYIVTSNDTVVISSSVNSDSFIEGSLYVELEPGDYNISVEVFNTFTSDIDPMVFGSSDFTVYANEVTDVFIVAKPVDPTVITEASTLVFDSNNFEPTIVTQYENSIFVGSELWYQITPESENLRLNLDYQNTPSTADFYFFIYDESGFITSSVASIHDGPTIELFQTAGNTYYIGVLYIDFAGGVNTNHVGELTVSMEEYIPVYTSIPVSEEWTDIILTEGETSLFIVENLEPGKTYDVEVMDRYDSPELEASVMFQDELGGNSFSSGFPLVYINEGESSFEFYLTSGMNTGSAKVRVVEWVDPNYIEPMEGYIPFAFDIGHEFYDVSRLSAVVIDSSFNPYVVVDTIDMEYVEGQERYIFYIPEYDNYDEYIVLLGLFDNTDTVVYQYGVYCFGEERIIDLYMDSPDVYNLSTPETIFLGESVSDILQISDYLRPYHRVFEQYIELDLTVEIVSKPVSSSLTPEDVTFGSPDLNTYNSDVYLSLTPDVTGEYVINLIVSNYYETTTKSIEFLVIGEDEGVLNVTFE